MFVESAWAQPLKIDRTIAKEPAYRTRTPKYGLLVFGPEGKDRVWLVLDGDTLYVDRNGNGDLTEPGERVAAEKRLDPAEVGYNFQIGDLTVGGRKHKALAVYVTPLQQFNSTSVGERTEVKAALARDPKALVVWLTVDVEVPGMKGAGLGGRLTYGVGPVDVTGFLQFANTPAEAPVVHIGGPLQVTFFAQRPSLRVGRASELVLVVGTPGTGPGTFAMLRYEETIPTNAWPAADVSLPPAKRGAPPLREKWEIKDRC
jgi:hypothetical protein